MKVVDIWSYCAIGIEFNLSFNSIISSLASNNNVLDISSNNNGGVESTIDIWLRGNIYHSIHYTIVLFLYCIHVNFISFIYNF